MKLVKNVVVPETQEEVDFFNYKMKASGFLLATQEIEFYTKGCEVLFK